MLRVILLGSLWFVLTVHAKDQLLADKEIFTEEATLPLETDQNSSKSKNKSSQSSKKPKTEEEDGSSPSILKPKAGKDPYESS